jgi:hypothetical protein
MRRAAVACVALWALLALPTPGAAQAEAWYNVDGIDYYYAAGTHASGRFAVGPDGDGQALQPFSGCGWGKLRPDNNKGRIQALGNWGALPLTIDVGEFAKPGRGPDSIQPNATVPAQASGFPAPLQAAMLATSSNATVRLGPQSIPDPVTGAALFDAAWFVTPHGFRDDATGAVQPPGQAESWEMHLRVASPDGGQRQAPALWQQAEPADGTPYLAPDEAHARLFTVPNERLFGKARLSADATSLAPAGSTDLELTVYAPDGSALGSLRLAPALNAPASQGLEFPLDQFGDYYVAVNGKASLAAYEVRVEQAAPERFVLDLWWDDVRPGYAGLQARNECDELLDGSVMTAYVAPRPPPIPFDWRFSLFTVGAGLTLLAVAAALTVTAYRAAVARRAVQA